MPYNKYDPVETFTAIAKQKDAKLVRMAIYKKYGFWVSDEYALDLVAFVEKLHELNEKERAYSA